MDNQSLNDSIVRCRVHFKSVTDAMKGYVVVSDDKIFVNNRGTFIFDTKEDALKSFYYDCRHLCYARNHSSVRADWDELKKSMNIKVQKI